MSLLELGVLAAAAWSLVALFFQMRRARGYGRSGRFAVPAGDPRRGVLYAFGAGMSPRAKESVMMHLPSYVAGLAYHAGVFSGLLYLALGLVGLQSPALVLWGLRALMLGGALGGVALFVKRVSHPQLRALSCPDDYLANLLATAFVGLSLAVSFVPAVVALWMSESIVLLVYLPIGKIRHCCFFFSTRYHFGTFFGQRGVYPPTASRT